MKRKSLELDYLEEQRLFAVYLVVQIGIRHDREGNPWYNIRAICSSEELANRYKESFERTEHEWDEDTEVVFNVERNFLDHAGGANKWYFAKELEKMK